MTSNGVDRTSQNVFPRCVALNKAVWGCVPALSPDHLELVYFVTALVPSLTACFASSPGRRSLTEV